MTFAGEAAISGFIGKVISDCLDISWEKIKEANKNRNNRNQNFESQIYNIIVEVINRLIVNKYKNNQDKVYQAAERILICCKNTKGLTIECAKSGLLLLDVNVNDNMYINFKVYLYEELCKNDYEVLYREVRLFQQDEESSKTSRIEKKVDKLEDGVRAVNKKLDSLKGECEVFSIAADLETKFHNNKKQNYIETWDSKLFLHFDNDKKPLTLSEAFIMPDYKCHTKMRRMGFSDEDKLSDIIEKFVNYTRSSRMLITGVPGIGKTSITAWIANKYKDDENIVILRFRDWEREELEKGLIKSICNTLKCQKQDLENIVLVLDGFDEIKALDIRESLLRAFFNESLDLKNFKFIITSRPTYINFDTFQNVFEILPFDSKKVSMFYQRVTGNELEQEKIDPDNLEVLGIPVILYMAIVSGIDLAQKATKPELYERIFAENGGIFDKFYYEGVGYDEGAQVFRNPENIKKYLKFLQDTAFMMFDHNSDSLPRENCQIPELEFDKGAVPLLEFPIKYLFERSDVNIEFIHKSIYEYFVADYIAASMCKGVKLSAEDFAGMFGDLLKHNRLPPDILEFLKYKVEMEELNSKSSVIKDTFELMLQDGMIYYTGKSYKNVIDCEMSVFVNMLDIVHLWEWTSLKFNSLITTYLSYNRYFGLNLKNTDLSGANLSEANLRKANLRKANLSEANLTGAYLLGANLSEANLTGAHLLRADLKGANLSQASLLGANLRVTNLLAADLTEANLLGVDLIKANLSRANLSGADLSGADLTMANLHGADLTEANLSGVDLRETHLINADLRQVKIEGADLKGVTLDDRQVKYLEKTYDLHQVNVWMNDTNEAISYAEYCSRTRKCNS